MRDLIGRTLGHYRIVDKIGEGGMGVVYRAQDERLDRDVAVKVLPEAVAGVQDRLERFEREAKLLASLNHPNIATLHGLEEEGSRRFLVMELVEGESLAGVLARGAIPVDEALPIALQIANAMETAHEHGVIHRDLKPANVMVDSEGQVKVLDFGLAKAFDPNDSPPQSPESIAESPTLTAEMTCAGTLLGTAAYMSPEQARGKSVDKRADIWAFGCVLYEMLTGTRAFAGTTSTEVLAGIIKDHPDWDALPVEAPTPVRSLLRRCLTKDPRDRLHDIADGRIELQSSSSNNYLVDAPTAAPQTDRSWRFWLVLTLAAAAGIAVGDSLRYWWPENSVELKSPIRFEIVLPKDQQLNNFGSHGLALSPDGTRLVFSANRRLYLRSMDDFESSAIRGSEDFASHLPPRSLFFSPDGEHVGFWADGRLRKIHIAGGAPVSICDTLDPWGAHWGANEQILFGRGTSGIWSVDANGGSAKQVISVDAEKGEFALGPQMLADGDHVLFTIITGRGMKNSKIVVHSQKTGRRHLLVDGGTDGLYVSTGHILYVQGGTLFAAEFDSENFELLGRAVSVLDGLLQPGIVAIGSGQYSISRTGTLAYMTRSTESNLSHMAWVDRNGEVTPILDHTKNFGYLSLSPSGDRAAATITNGVNREIWVFDLLGSHPPFPIRRGGCSWDPVWTPDGQKIIFSYAETTNTTEDLYWVSADGNDIEPGLIHAQDGQQYAYSISADGEELFFTDYGKGEKRDVWVLDLTDTSNRRLLLDSEFDELHAAVSPNERWLAYTSNRTGREEIWVTSYPDLQRRRPVSIEGGREPRWSQDGSELFYRDADKMMVVAVTTDSTEFHTDSPRVLFEGKFWGYPAWPTYGVAPDGRFLMIQRTDLSTWGGDPQRLHIIVNWFEELKRLAPTE